MVNRTVSTTVYKVIVAASRDEIVQALSLLSGIPYGGVKGHATIRLEGESLEIEATVHVHTQLAKCMHIVHMYVHVWSSNHNFLHCQQLQCIYIKYMYIHIHTSSIYLLQLQWSYDG